MMFRDIPIKQSKAKQNKIKFLRTGIKILGSKMWPCPSSLSTYSEANQLFYLQKFVWDFCVYGLHAMCFADVVLGIPHALYLHCVGEDGTKTKCARVACYHLYFHYCYWKNQGGKFFPLHSHFSYNHFLITSLKKAKSCFILWRIIQIIKLL